MPNISKSVPHEAFEAMRERAEAARGDGEPHISPLHIPDATFAPIQPQWPDDAIVPDKKDYQAPEAEVIETAPADEIDGEQVAHTTFAEKAELALSKIENLTGEKAVSPEVETATSSFGGIFRDAMHDIGDIATRAQIAIEAASANDIVETQADDVYEAETVPVEADDDSDPYDSEP